MNYGTLDLWIDAGNVIECMGIRPYHRAKLNEYVNLDVHEVDTQLEKDILLAITTLYDGLCFYFRTDSGMIEFMNSKYECFNGRSCWDIIVTHPNHVKKRCDLVLGLVDRLHQSIAAQRGKRF